MFLWPAHSLDMSHIKHVWEIVGQQLVYHGPPATIHDALQTCIQMAWKEIPQEHTQALCDFIP
jgi:hypothetical protein